MSLVSALFSSLSRDADRRMQRPTGLVYWLDTPSPLVL